MHTDTEKNTRWGMTVFNDWKSSRNRESEEKCPDDMYVHITTLATMQTLRLVLSSCQTNGYWETVVEVHAIEISGKALPTERL